MKKSLCLIGLILLPLALCSCDDGGGGSSGPAEGVDVTGTWRGISSYQISFTGHFVQQPDGTLSGSTSRQEGYTGSVSGRVSGNSFNMHVIWTYGAIGDYEGDIIGNAMEGTFVETSGGIRQTGTFTAFRQ